MSAKKIPQEPGYYWAVSNGKEWFDSIVQVYGEAPFFKVIGYSYCDNKEIRDISEIHCFGDKIEEIQYY